jgi:hypothetical protein
MLSLPEAGHVNLITSEACPIVHRLYPAEALDHNNHLPANMKGLLEELVYATFQ